MDREDLVTRTLNKLEKLQRDRQQWNVSFELISEFVRSRKRGFVHEFSPGQFLTGKIFDSTAGRSNHKMASSMLGALYPNSKRAFELRPAFNLPGRESHIVKQYFSHITKVQGRSMDHPKARLQSALSENLEDGGAFGTAGIYTRDTGEKQSPSAYKAIGIKHMFIDEDLNGVVDVVYLVDNLTIRQVVQKYGEENVSEYVRDKFNKRDFSEKIKILQAIEPREHKKHGSPRSKDLPIQSIHIEIQQKHLLKESGFTQMPITVARFWKESDEVYGRSPSWEAMPDILEANAEREAAIIAIEKHLDPPLAVYNDGSLGGGVIDTSAGALNVFNVNARSPESRKMIEQLVTTGELRSTYERLIELQKIIEDNYFIDRLLDLNNDTRMTAFETDVRDKLRGQSLGSIYGRQISETFDPVIERTFDIHLRNGHFGVVEGSEEYHMQREQGLQPLIIPEPVVRAMVNGDEVYEIDYISPAARVMRQEELLGIKSTVGMAVEMSQIIPNVGDNLDGDKIIREYQELTGATTEIIRSMEEVEGIREQRAQQEAQMAEIQSQIEEARAAKDIGLAQQASAKAQELRRVA